MTARPPGLPTGGSLAVNGTRFFLRKQSRLGFGPPVNHEEAGGAGLRARQCLKLMKVFSYQLSAASFMKHNNRLYYSRQSIVIDQI